MLIRTPEQVVFMAGAELVWFFFKFSEELFEC